MEELTEIINNTSQYRHTTYNKLSSMPIGDVLRFHYVMWPFPDAAQDEEIKYFDQKYIIMSKRHLRSLQNLINMSDDIDYDYESLIESLRIELPRHSTLIYENNELQQLASEHSDSNLKVESVAGARWSDLLSTVELRHDMVFYRTLSEDYNEKLEIGDRVTTKDVWSTSYDPISSLGFALSDPDADKLYVLKLNITAGFHGGLLIENTHPYVIKLQHEFTIGAGISFRVKNIKDGVRIKVPDTEFNTRNVEAKIYYLENITS